MAKLDGEACVLRCVYLFICLFIVCLCACFLIIFKELFVGSCINYVLQRRLKGWRWRWLFLWSCVAVLMSQLWFVLFPCGFDGKFNESFAFIFNLLLLPFIPIYTKIQFLCINQCIDLVCKSVYWLLLRGNDWIIIRYSIRVF